MKIVYNGVEITLTENAEAANYGTDGNVEYTATGKGSDGHTYLITWATTEEWNDAVEEGIDKYGEPNNSYCQDESNACDWDNPIDISMMR